MGVSTCGRGDNFCATVGPVGQDTIRRSIENQQWDDPGENFKITAPTEP